MTSLDASRELPKMTLCSCNHMQMIQSVLESPPPMLSSQYFSSEFCEFLQNCLQKQPLDRASADVLLESPWLQRCAAVSTLDRLVLSIHS